MGCVGGCVIVFEGVKHYIIIRRYLVEKEGDHYIGTMFNHSSIVMWLMAHLWMRLYIIIGDA